MVLFYSELKMDGIKAKNSQKTLLVFQVSKMFIRILTSLLIQRKDSLGFVELMRGKYKVDDIPYIKVQLAGFTDSEKTKILTEPFDTLWQNLWGYDPNAPSHAYKNEKDIARTKLEQLRNGFTLPDGSFVSLERLFQDIPSQWITPEWGFPKGRRDGKETELRCANA
jgi:hypothetical protein